MKETFEAMKELGSITRQVKDEYYSNIIKELGGRELCSCTYRLGDYNIYTSKGFVLHKSNQGESIPLHKFLKENYNIETDVRESIDTALEEAGFKRIK